MTDASRTPDPIAPSSADPLTDDLIALDRQLEDPANSAIGGGVWWWVLLRGILAIAFGVIALFSPLVAFDALVLVFGVYAIFDGVMEIVHGVATRKTAASWGWMIVAGVVSVIAGAVALVLPFVTGIVLGLLVLWTIVAYNFVHGIMVIAASAKFERGRAWGIVAGVISILFSVVLAILLLVTPVGALFGLIFAVGIYAIVFGVALAVAAISARASRGAKAVVGTPAL